MSSILFTADAAGLTQVRRPGVQAVILAPSSRKPWQSELAAAVESSAFAVERSTLMVSRIETLAHTLENRLPHERLSFETRLALIDDLVEMAAHLAEIACCRALMLRFLAEAPSDHCGFHVDTVPAQRPPFGLLKVYNGHGTYYVNPDDVTAMYAFYSYLGKRERLVRECVEAMGEDAEQARGDLAALDDALPFLRPAASIHEVPAGAEVAFRLLDVRDHWSRHPRDRAWIHCSPMEGAPRLVANFTPLDGAMALPA